MLDFSRFKRPRKLSDPGRDFNREDLEAILATDDRAMGFYEFACLFGEWLPAGTYDECAYFLPHCLAYLDREGRSPHGETDLVDHVLGWVKSNRQALKRDGLEEGVIAYFVSRLKRQLSAFRFFQNGDGDLHPGFGEVEELIDGLNDLGNSHGDETLRGALATEAYEPHAWACYLAYWYRVVPFNSILIDELAMSSIKLSASGEIVAHYVQSHPDALLEKFWKEYLV